MQHDAGYFREEPGAGKPPARICEGGAKWPSYSTTAPRRLTCSRDVDKGCHMPDSKTDGGLDHEINELRCQVHQYSRHALFDCPLASAASNFGGYTHVLVPRRQVAHSEARP